MKPDIDDVETHRELVMSYPDGSAIEMWKHRYSPIADWIPGPHFIRCWQSSCKVMEEPTLQDAQIYHLTHQLEHAREDIAEIKRTMSNGKHHQP